LDIFLHVQKHQAQLDGAILYDSLNGHSFCKIFHINDTYAGSPESGLISHVAANCHFWKNSDHKDCSTIWLPDSQKPVGGKNNIPCNFCQDTYKIDKIVSVHIWNAQY